MWVGGVWLGRFSGQRLDTMEVGEKGQAAGENGLCENDGKPVVIF